MIIIDFFKMLIAKCKFTTSCCYCLLVVIVCVSWHFRGSFFKLLRQFHWVIGNYQKKKKVGDLHRTATTTYPCCLPALGGSAELVV